MSFDYQMVTEIVGAVGMVILACNMKRLIQWIGEYPQHAFWFSIPIILLIGWLNRSSMIDVQIHDTYFVTSVLSVAIFAAVYFGLLSLLYYVIRDRPLASWMNIVHVVSSITFILIVVLHRRGAKSNGLDYTRIDGQTFMDRLSNGLEYALVMGTMVFLFIQMMFFINMMGGVFKKK